VESSTTLMSSLLQSDLLTRIDGICTPEFGS